MASFSPCCRARHPWQAVPGTADSPGLVALGLGREPAGRVKLAPDGGTERRLNKAGPVCSPNPRFVEWCLLNYLRRDLRKEGFELILTTEVSGVFLVTSRGSLRFTGFCQCHLMETYQVRPSASLTLPFCPHTSLQSRHFKHLLIVFYSTAWGTECGQSIVICSLGGQGQKVAPLFSSSNSDLPVG